MRNQRLLTAFLLAGFCYCTQALRQEKNIGIFNVVKFPNEACDSTSTKNGTCYTEEECSNKGGKAEGSCADGYGVCCVFTYGCGDTSSENGTYFDSSAGIVGQCNLRVCRCQSNICQLRLDFMTFVIQGPSTADDTVGEFLAGEPGTGQDVTAQTQCQADQFAVTNPGGPSPPVICGTNTGEHMYVDAAEACNTLSFQLSSATFTRSWAIKVTQYTCDYNNLAPAGCTQYFWGATTGTITSYNYANKLHLANQNQAICFRRERNTCQLCLSAADGTDFRVSGMAEMAFVEGCAGIMGDGMATKADQLIIPSPSKAANAGAVAGDSGFCGAELAATDDSTDDITVCTKRLPFVIRFVTDSAEFLNEVMAATAGKMNNEGFTLSYKLNSC